MPETAHEKRLKKIEAETLEIKKQIMQLEFQHKKDIVAADKRIEASEKRFEETKRVHEEWDSMMTKKIQHIAQLVGITYEELDNLDLKVKEAGQVLSKPRKPTTLA